MHWKSKHRRSDITAIFKDLRTVRRFGVLMAQNSRYYFYRIKMSLVLHRSLIPQI